MKTIEDLQSDAHIALLSAEIDALVHDSLNHAGSERFELDAYFGRDPAELHPALARRLFTLAPVPLLRAHFEREHGR